MTRHTAKQPKRPGLLSLILNDVREVLRQNRQKRELAKALADLAKNKPEPLARLAKESLGDAWLALADYYASHHSENPALATEAYRNAAESNEWLTRSTRPQFELDRRRFLGIGATQDFEVLLKQWKGAYEPGYLHETQLAWIHTFGPAGLRDLHEAWWWVALAEARWGQLQDADLPTHSALEIRQSLFCSVAEKDRIRIQLKAKEYAYQEFVRGK